jgi:amino acid transporter
MASTYPEQGGEYVYLAYAFGPRLAFLFAWMNVCAILPGNMGAAALILAGYAGELHPWLAENPIRVAICSVIVLMLLQWCGLRSGKLTQNVLTLAKILALLGVFACALLVPGAASLTGSDAPAATDPRHSGLSSNEAAGTASGTASDTALGTASETAAVTKPAPLRFDRLGLALVFVMYAYGGWSDVACVAPEVRNCRRNVPLAMLTGLLLIAVLYLALNAAFLHSLGFAGLAASQAPAADVVRRAIGPAGSHAVALLVMASALGSINGMMLTGCRLLAAVGEDFRIFRCWNYWNARGVPVWALLTLTGLSCLLMVLVGHPSGRNVLDQILQALWLPVPLWEQYHGGFNTLFAATAPGFWIFFLMSGMALLVLRFRHPGRPRPFSVPLYPLPPLIFMASAGYMLWSSVRYAGLMTLLLLPTLLVGGVLMLFHPRHRLR